ncbi:hypothetical protein DFQ27_007425 [Actinomortierella ambigua]|uniref:Uncharacterized protein n=1 Tax=Actinomortierella ambigua TaxID=1343610 RepID=A0A9P6PSY5_9FUNG|nr:hypothetical protein DFQ27_007425 [Actinomortierella ambigua]
MAESAPKTEDYTRWATDHTHHASHLPESPPIPHDSNTLLVSQPFTQNVKATCATGVSLFNDPRNHPDAVGTILTYAAKQTNFCPSEGLAGQIEQFHKYITKVSTFPGFMLTFDKPTSHEITTDNLTLMIDDIIRAYEGVVDADITKIVSSIEAMANSIINSSSSGAGPVLFTQMTIMGNSGDPSLLLTIFYTTLQMKVSTSGKKTIASPQSYTIHRKVFEVLTASLVANAEALFKLLGNGTFEEWLKRVTSGGGPKLSCLEERHLDAKKET